MPTQTPTIAERMNAALHDDDDAIEKGGYPADKLKVNKVPFPHKKRTGPATVRPGGNVPKHGKTPEQLKGKIKKGDEAEGVDETDGSVLTPPEGVVEKGKGAACKSCGKYGALCKCAGSMSKGDKEDKPVHAGASAFVKSMHGMTDADIAAASQSGILGLGGTPSSLGFPPS